MRARALLLAALTALACARPCSPSGFADAMDVAAARRVLGVEGVASAEQTRAAFHRASLRAHPDKPGGSHEAFVEVTEAYEVLRNSAAAPSQSSFPSGESRRDGAGGHSRGGGAASDGYAERESSESHFAWRFSFSSDADADDADAERSARARERAFEQFQRSRRAWSSSERDADARFSKNENRGGTGRRTWWDGGKRATRDASSGDAFFIREDRAAQRDDDRRHRRHHHRTDSQSETSLYDYVYGEHANTRGGDRDTYDKWWDTRSDVKDFGFDVSRFAGRFGGADKNGAPHASRDAFESMEEYVYRRAWADARGVAGHDRRLDDGEADSFSFSSEAPFLDTASPYEKDADFGWDAARRRTSHGGA